MLPRSIVSRFEAEWVDVSHFKDENNEHVFNEGAEFLVLPLTLSSMQRFAEKHKICANCSGAKIVRDAGGRQEVCPLCKGQSRGWVDAEARIGFLRTVVKDWRHVLVQGPGGPTELEYSDAARDALAEFPGVFAAILSAAQDLAGTVGERTEKG